MHFLLPSLFALCTGCAVLHRTQLSDIDSAAGKPISIKVSENTINFAEVGAIMKGVGGVAKSSALKKAGDAFALYTTLFQYGPRTGAPVYNELYARDIAERLVTQCPGGRLTNITSLRESREYPVVKGEIVRIDATCVQR